MYTVLQKTGKHRYHQPVDWNTIPNWMQADELTILFLLLQRKLYIFD